MTLLLVSFLCYLSLTLTMVVSDLGSFGDPKNRCSADDDRDEMMMTTSLSGDEITFRSSSPGREPRTNPPAELHETDEAIYIRVEATGLCREDVKVTVEGDVLIIKAEAKRDNPTSSKFEAKLDLSEEPFKLEEVLVELMDNMLYVVVPKVKDEAS